MPGILPEPDVIIPEGEEMTESERKVLRDLESALPESDRAPSDASEANAAPVELPRQRAQFPWWYGAVFFLLSGSMLVASAWFAATTVALRTAYLLVGVLLLWFALKAWTSRHKPKGPA